jgi:hypothetical protein
MAQQAGLNELIAEVLASNSAMLTIFKKSGLKMSARSEGQVVQVTLTYG